MSQWTPEKPGEGDTETLVTIAATLDLIAEASLQRGQITTTAVNLQPGFWTGAAANTWNSALSPALPRATTLASSLTSAANALRAYHDEVADIKLSAELNQKEAEAEVSNASHEGVRCYIRPTYGGTRCMANRTTLISAWDDDFERKEERALDYTGRLRRLDTALEMLATRRTTADSTLKNALNAAMGSDWSERYALFTSVGITDPGQMTGERLAEEFAVYLEGAVTGFTSGLSEEELTRIEEFYRLYGTNESVLSVMYENLGGDGLRTVMQRLEERATAGNDSGEFIETTLLPIAGQIRDGLALGSQNWSEKVSQNFADHLFGVEKGSTSYGQVSAFLFDGLKPFGPNLALALANSLDKSERILGRPVMDGTAEATDISRHSALLSRDRALTGRDTSFPIDVASGVFTQLSHHPDQAVSFFSTLDGVEASEKTDFWFKMRNWNDGHTAPVALIESFQRASGSLMSDPAHQDLGVLALTASLVGRGLTILDKNIDDQPISEAATTSIAKILALNLYDLQETTFSLGTEPGDTFRNLVRDAEGRLTGATLHVDIEIFTNWAGRAQQTLTGMSIIQEAAHLIDMHVAGTESAPTEKNEQLLAAATMRGQIDVGLSLVDMRIAALQDAQQNQARELAFDVIGVIPWTARLRLPGAADAVASAGTSWGLSAVSDALLPHGLEDAKERAEANKEKLHGDEQYRLALMAIGSGVQTSAPPPPLVEGEPAYITDAHRAWAEAEWANVASDFSQKFPEQISLGTILTAWKNAAGYHIAETHGG